jgi:putative transposase
VNRGAGRRDIFLTDEHKDKFLEIVSHAVRIFGIELHAYCLMSNHYHLLVKTPRGNLSEAMRHINGVYTKILMLLKKPMDHCFEGATRQ